MNGIIIIDKPEDWTSHDIVAKLRGLLKEKRVGHGGTLDPMATGVLPVFVGRATRAVQFCEDFDKEYVAGLRLGLVTDTQDTTGRVLGTSTVAVTRQALEETLRQFVGTQDQTPPMYSAVKVGGKKLYELARRGQVVDRAPRRITISSIEPLDTVCGADGCVSDAVLRVVCSKGTYIRTLCHDIGAVLGCGGVMSSLRRTRVGPFTLSESVRISDCESVRISDFESIPVRDVESGVQAGNIRDKLRPVDILFSGYPDVTLDAGQKAKCTNGAEFTVGAGDGLYRVYDDTGGFLMLGRVERGVMKSVKSFFDV
jgi:tRNA pseudouridine55 synthase